MKEIGLHCPNCGHCLHMPSGRALGITRGQRKMLDAIANLLMRNKVSPTYDELAQELGLKSKSPVAHHIEQLRMRGYLVEGKRGYGRQLALTPNAWAAYLPTASQEAKDAA